AKYGGLVAVMVIVTAANFFFFIQPTEEQIQRQTKEIARLKDSLAEKQAIAQNLNERRREMDRLEQQLAEALTELPENKDIDELLAQLNDIGKKSGLRIERIEPGAEQPANFFAKIPVKMAVNGNYHEIAVFLQEVANMRRIVNVNNIKLSGSKAENEKVILQSEFLATTFRFIEPKAKVDDSKGGKAKGKK
ncbi:MAG: type 4a pilus biogenesis protein PilO, partial [Myxococcaceae bacterium]